MGKKKDDQLTSDAILKQSQAAYKQWAPQWREHATFHSKYAMKSWQDFFAIGIGKACVLAANGWSLELEMDVLREHQKNVDIICCDKSLGHLLRNGIRPTYCLVADANVNYEKYLQPWETELGDTILFMNVCGNPKWTERGNWKDLYFFANMDILHSEREFVKLSGCVNVMPAGTNVSNAMMVLLTQSDNDHGRRNFFGYDKLLLVGYDYCWRLDGNYYAYSKDGDGKANYMRHVYTRTIGGDFAVTSNNLAFSAFWASKYVDSFKLPVVQCSKESIFQTPYQGVLSEQIRYAHRREDSLKFRRLDAELAALQVQADKARLALRDMALEHYRSLIATT
jgi:hypothetical protein